MRKSARQAKKRFCRRMLCVFFALLTGLLFSIVQANAQASFPDQRTVVRGRQFEAHFAEAASQHSVDVRLLWVIAYLESRFRPGAVSRSGARGLMQLMPATAQRFGVRNSHDPAQAIAGAAQYTRFLLQRYGGRIDLTLAAYNAGEAAVEAYQTGRTLRVGSRLINPSRIVTGGVPPYRETQKYVREGLQLLQQFPPTSVALTPEVVPSRPSREVKKSIAYHVSATGEELTKQFSSDAVQSPPAKRRSILFQHR